MTDWNNGMVRAGYDLEDAENAIDAVIMFLIDSLRNWPDEEPLPKETEEEIETLESIKKQIQAFYERESWQKSLKAARESIDYYADLADANSY